MRKARWPRSLLSSIPSAKCQRPPLGSSAHSGKAQGAGSTSTEDAGGGQPSDPELLVESDPLVPGAVDAEGGGCNGGDELPGSRVQVLHGGLERSNLMLSSLGGSL